MTITAAQKSTKSNMQIHSQLIELNDLYEVCTSYSIVFIY